MLAREVVEADAVNVLNDEVGLAIAGTAIDQVGNIRVLQGGQNLALLAKALVERAGPDAKVGADEFDSDLLLEVAGAASEENGSHPALPQEALDAIRADLARQIVWRIEEFVHRTEAGVVSEPMFSSRERTSAATG